MLLPRRHPSRKAMAIPRLPCLLAVALLWAPCALDAANKFKPFQLKTVDGSAKTLADFPGKAILVGFFFPSCRFCNAALPEIEKIYGRYKDQGLSAVWINIVPEEDGKIAGWQARNRSAITVLTGASQASLQRDYKVRMTPTHYLLNADGEVLLTLAGFKKGDEKVLEEKVKAALTIAP
jgi:cytochrome oxidase Cu insertion factor (SCO1/SenC/PrrC family)